MMKKTTLIFTLMSMLLLGVAVSAQEKAGIDSYISVDEAAKLGRLPRGFPVDVYQRVPKGCPREAKAYVVTRNAATGTAPSSELIAYMTKNTYKPVARKYGQRGIDQWFVDTLPLGSCKICAATLVADLVNEGGLSTNDGLAIWLADPSSISGPPAKPTFLVATSAGSGAVAGKPSLWGLPVQTAKILTLDLNQAGNVSDALPNTVGLPILNNYIFTTTGTPGLDIYIQDDTTVNSLQLVVWR